MKQLLIDQVAIVTGGASGLGYATVEKFVEQGAKVVIADVNSDQGEALAAKLGSATVFKQTDVSNREQVEELVEYALEYFGDLHVMFNNAGISGAVHNSYLDDDLADFDKVIGVNLYGTMVGSRAAKAGVIHYTKSIAKELGEYGVRANCIRPGHIAAGQTFYDIEEMIRIKQPLDRIGKPEDVANAALYLASELSAQVTGLVLPVDGGSNLWKG
jgi:NAD(P)-dependent dehydrogenase (short-subunit alcohol dehydrogenase family)